MTSASTVVGLPILSVTDLTHAIRQQLEGQFPVAYVQGEITNFKRHTSGHLYFTLKDEAAQIAAVMFAGQARTLSKLPANGDQVVVRAQLSVYPARGNYQLYVKEVQWVGLGELLAKFQALKEQLRAMGWFDPAHKQPLPYLPKRIGVITSPTGAVIQDIVHVLERRHPGFQLFLYPVRVQGEGAASEIAAAIDALNQHPCVDLLILARGGGSLEDLWAFNEMEVAEAIHRSRLPLISAVGHETDVTIADFVADVRAPTPSAAAEMVLPDKMELRNQLAVRQQQLLHRLRQILHLRERQLHLLRRHPILASPEVALSRQQLRVADLMEAVERTVRLQVERGVVHLHHLEERLALVSPSRRVREQKLRIGDLPRLLARALRQTLAHHHEHTGRLQQALTTLFVHRTASWREKIMGLQRRLEAVHPQKVLQRGYAMLVDPRDGQIVCHADRRLVGHALEIQLADGMLKVRVEAVEPQESMHL